MQVRSCYIGCVEPSGGRRPDGLRSANVQVERPGPVSKPTTGRDSLTVTDAVVAASDGLPTQIRRSLTWDCGAEMARHAAVAATGLLVFFAHPHSDVRYEGGPLAD